MAQKRLIYVCSFTITPSFDYSIASKTEDVQDDAILAVSKKISATGFLA